MRKADVQTEKEPWKKEYSALRNMGYIMRGTFQYQKALLFFFPLAIVTAVVISYLPTFALSAIIDRVTAACSAAELMQTVAIFFSALLLVMLIQNYANANIGWRMYHARIKIMMRRIHKVLSMDYEHLESAKVMEMCQRAMRATGGETNGAEGMMRSFQSLMVMLVSVATAVVIVWRLSPWMVLLMAFLGLCSYFNLDGAKRFDKKTWDEMAPYWRKTWYMMQTMTNFAYGKDVRLFSMKDWLMGKYRDLNDHLHDGVKKSYSRWMRCAALNQLMYLGEEAGLYGYLLYRVLSTDMSIAEFTLYLGAVRTFFTVLQSVFGIVTDMKNQSREINDFRSFLEYPDQEANAAALPLSVQGPYRFQFENVSFRYPNAKEYALKSMSLTLEAGERLAVVGMNGAGKSTFIKLLCGLYTPTEGQILLDGVNIQEISPDEYVKLLSVVFQDFQLFAFTARENVTLSESHAKPEDVRKNEEKLIEEFGARAVQATGLQPPTVDPAFDRVMAQCGLTDTMEKLKYGADTFIQQSFDEEGVELSGGQQQKLAIARALYKDAPIVILDEPTAALDPIAEYEIYRQFHTLVGGKTAIYISHRLSSCQFCDVIYGFADGQIKETGTHAELVKRANGLYARMFEAQAQYYR